MDLIFIESKKNINIINIDYPEDSNDLELI
jgi:hypothetical protein